jgi:uncharacterized coiled-coil protein SlyX
VDVEVQRLGGLVYSFTSGVKQTGEVFQTVQTVTGDAVQAGDRVAQTSQSIIEAVDLTATAMDAITVLSHQITQQSQDAQRISDQMSHLSETLGKNVQVFRLPEAVTAAIANAVLPESDADLFEPEPVFESESIFDDAVDFEPVFESESIFDDAAAFAEFVNG